MELTSGTGVIGLAADPPRKMRAPLLELEALVNGDWRPVEVVDLSWQEDIKMFVIEGVYTNASQAADFVGAFRLCLVGRPVTAFVMPEAGRIPPGETVAAKCPFSV